MSTSGYYGNATEVDDSVQLILDIGVVKAYDSIGSPNILYSYREYVLKFVFAVSTIVRDLLATRCFQCTLKKDVLLRLSKSCWVRGQQCQREEEW